MRNLFIAPFALVAFAAPLLFADEASAACNLSACGDIDVSLDAKCELKVSGGCEAECTPFNAALTCEADCSGGCTLTLPKCEIDCKAGCMGECTVNPGSFSCQADCELNIGAKCGAKCSAAADKTQCDASCKATFKAACSADCNVVPPSASCDVKCEAGCKGGCTGEANLDCQVKCQGGCVAEVSGGCKVACKTPEGALFCDGQFIDHGGNLKNCTDALKNCSIEVTVYADAQCAGGTCEAKAGFSCNAAPSSPAGSAPWMALGTVIAGIALSASRRRR